MLSGGETVNEGVLKILKILPLPGMGLEHQPSNKRILPARCTGTMVAQSLWEWLTKDWSNLRPILQQGAHARHCLDSQEPEIREPSDPEKHQT